MVKVLQVHGGMERGGTESVIMNWYRNIDKNEVQFDFTTMQEKRCAYDDEIESMGGKIIYVPSRAKVGNIGHFKALLKCFKENKYDIVHSHMNFHGGLVALAAKCAGVKNVICHAHNTEDVAIPTFKRKVEIKVLRNLIKIFSDEKVACTKEAGEYIFGYNSKFTIINNSIDLNKFYPINKSDMEIINIKNKYNLNNKLILGHVGRFSEQKNHKFIISIAENMVKQGIDFKFILIGDGEDREEILNEIKNKNLEEYFLYLGLQSDINIWFNVMDVFIFPSLYEGLGIVMIEAQATGLPCITSTNVPKEVDLNLGLVKFISINNGDLEEWINNIKDNYKNKITDKEFIKENIIKRGYSLEHNIKAVEDLYKNKI